MESIEILQQSKGIVQRNRQRCQQNDKKSLRDKKKASKYFGDTFMEN